MGYIEDSSTPPRRIGVGAHQHQFTFYVHFERAGRYVQVLVNADGPAGQTPVVHYTTTDCTGTEYNHVNQDQRLGGVGAVVGTTVYAAAATRESITVRSTRDPVTGTCSANNLTDTFHRLETFSFPAFTSPLRFIER
jgi:hypothetical protein